jgi:hypothetical protein
MAIAGTVFILTFICFFILFGKKKSENNNDEELSDNDSEENGNNEIEEQFYNEVRNGKEKYKFLKIDNQFDLMFIKSLFQSENIPYYIEFENISRMRPGMYVGDLGNYNLLYILDEDYNDAVEIVQEYIKTKKETSNENGNKETIRNISEVLLANWKVPSANDTNGIEIIYKK